MCCRQSLTTHLHGPLVRPLVCVCVRACETRRVGGAGMPAALTNHASIAGMSTQREGNGGSADALVGKMDGVLRRTGAAITGATDDKDVSASVGAVPVVEDRAGPGKKPNKHSVDYMMRSFVAGGLAGCAVCSPVSCH